MKARVLVGRNMRRLRVANGFSQEALGLAAGCEPSYIGRLERGRENPTVDLLEAIADSLGSPIAALFDADPQSTALQPGLSPGRKASDPGTVKASIAAPEKRNG